MEPTDLGSLSVTSSNIIEGCAGAIERAGFNFLRLPGELCNQIYRHLLVREDTAWLTSDPHPRPGCVQTTCSQWAIFFVNRQVNREATYIFYTEINFCFDGVFDKFTTFFNDRPPSVIGLIRRVSMFEEIILGRDKNKDDLRFWKWLCDLLRSRVQIKHMVLYLEGDVHTVTEAENGTTCEAECMEQLATITGLEKLDILSFDGTRSIKWAGLQAYLDSKMLRHHEESVS